jgi:transcriptional regulator with XRE-family HTH domain
MITNFTELRSQITRSERYDQEVLRGEISDQIDRLMATQGMTKAELSRKLGTSPAYVTKILRGNANFTLDSLVQIGRALGCKYVPIFVPVNIWKQIEAIQLSATATVQSGPSTEAYNPTGAADESTA